MNLESVRSQRLTFALLLTSASCLVAVAVPHPAAAGPASSAEFRVNTATASTQYQPAIATDADGDFVVVWAGDGVEPGNFDVWAQRFNAAGTPQGSETRVNAPSVEAQFQPAVAMDADGDYVVTWTSNGQDGSGEGVYTRRYSATGVPQGNETLVPTATVNHQNNPAVAMDADGDYVIAWATIGHDGSGDGVYARRYNAAGTPLGLGIQVNTATIDDQNAPSVAMDAVGNYVIAFTSRGGQDGHADGVFARRYNAGGTPLGVEALVNATTTGNQNEPSVAVDADGDMVIAWASNPQDGSDSGVYAQRFDAEGAPQGTESRVNTVTTSAQDDPSAAMDADGDYVISWDSYLQDGSLAGVYAQRYDAAGAPQGTETRVNTTTADSQEDPAVAMDADGEYVVAWTSWNQDGGDRGIYGRRYRGPQPVDLALTQSDNADPIAVGGRLTYRIRVINRNPESDATGVEAIDAAIGAASSVYVISALPDGASLVSATGTGWTCGPASATIRCKLGATIPAGGVAPGLLLTYTAPMSAGPAIHVSRAYVGQVDPVSSNDIETERTGVLCALGFAAPAYSANETATVNATVTRTGTDCGSSGISYATSAGSANADSDYTHVAGTLAWADGETSKTISIPVVDDGLDERSEQFSLRLTDATGALLGSRSLVAATILDDDDPPRINFTTTAATAGEPGALLDVTVVLSEVSGQDVTLNLAKTGSATYLTDYYAPKRLTIPAGQRTATFTIEVADDNLDEANEIASLSLGSTSTATLGVNKTFRLTITDND